MRLSIVTSHPIQYQGPLFRALAQRVDLHVYFAHRATEQDQRKLRIRRARSMGR